MPAIIPLAAMAVSAGVKAYQGHKANQANKSALEQENANSKADFDARQKIVTDLASKGFDIYGPQTSTQSSTGGGTQRTNYEEMFRNNPFITEQYKPMEGAVRKLIEGRLGQATTVTEGEKAAQIRNINAANAGAMASVRNLMGGGASRMQLGAAAMPAQMARAGEIGNYMATLPDIERARRNQDLGLASGAINAFGKGEEGTKRGSSTTNSSNWSNGSSTSGPNIGNIMALMAPGAQVSTKTGASPWLGALGDVAGGVASYAAGGGKFKKPKVAYAGSDWD